MVPFFVYLRRPVCLLFLLPFFLNHLPRSYAPVVEIFLYITDTAMSPRVHLDRLQDELTSGLETTKFIQKLISDVRRVDGIYEILYVAYNAVAQEQDGMHLSTEKRNALVNEMHQLFEFAVLNLVCFSLSPTFLLPLLKLDRNAPPF